MNEQFLLPLVESHPLRLGERVSIGWGDATAVWESVQSRMPEGSALSLVAGESGIDVWEVVSRE